MEREKYIKFVLISLFSKADITPEAIINKTIKQKDIIIEINKICFTSLSISRLFELSYNKSSGKPNLASI